MFALHPGARFPRSHRAIALFVCCAAIGVSAGPARAATVTQTFTSSGETPFVVPATVTALRVDAVGAAGNPSQNFFTGVGGRGAEVLGTLPVSPGETVFLEVGVGGGPGGHDLGAGSGGGASGVQLCPSSGSCTAYPASPAWITRVLVAAGGGEGGETSAVSSGGAGGNGGLLGAAGGAGQSADSGGGGGTSLTAICTPGAGTSQGVGGSQGSLTGIGGAGGQGTVAVAPSGGGGGGGYIGGCGAGGGDSIFQAAGGGGGGASFANNPQLVDYTSTLPTISDYSSDTPTGGTPRVTLSYDDLHIPVAHLTSPTTGEQFGATPHFTGQAERGVDIATSVSISVYSDSSNTLVQSVDAPVAADGSFTVDASGPLPSGAYTAFVTQTLLGGGNPGISSVSFHVDAASPQISLTQPANNLDTNTTPKLFAGTAGTKPKDGTTIKVSLYRGSQAIGVPLTTRSTTSQAGGAFDVPYPGALAEGTYTVLGSQTDNGANTGTATATFTIDTSAPQITLGAPSIGEHTGSRPTFSGTAGIVPNDSNQVHVLVYAGGDPSGAPVQTLATTTAPSGAFSVPVSSPLARGTYIAVAEQRDLAQNLGKSAAATFTVDAPTTVTTTTSTTSTTTTTTSTKGPPPPTTPMHVSIVGSPSGAGGHARVTIACAGRAGSRCNVPWRLTTVERFAGRRLVALAAVSTRTGSRTVTVGRGTVIIPAGRRVTVALAPGDSGRRLLSQFGRVPVRLSLSLLTGRVPTLAARRFVVIARRSGKTSPGPKP